MTDYIPEVGYGTRTVNENGGLRGTFIQRFRRLGQAAVTLTAGRSKTVLEDLFPQPHCCSP